MCVCELLVLLADARGVCGDGRQERMKLRDAYVCVSSRFYILEAIRMTPVAANRESEREQEEEEEREGSDATVRGGGGAQMEATEVEDENRD